MKQMLSQNSTLFGSLGDHCFFIMVKYFTDNTMDCSLIFKPSHYF